MTIIHKKLIEVALPLEAINKASAREKSIRHGNPSTLHLWWARRPLAAARAVIFAQMVDDPSAHPDIFTTEKTQEKERQRLFRIIEDLVQWENTTNEEVLEQARAEIWQSWRAACAENVDHPRAKELFNRHKLPAFHDPFAGGGALPLEAQRLGLEAFASDLNPVAVLINKAMIEIPPKYAGKPPVNPESRKDKELFNKPWHRAQGLAEDVRYYGQWMRDEAERRIGHLYPKVEITAAMSKERPDLDPYVGKKLTVIAWLWARTVKSPNPAFSQVDVPLASTFMLCPKPGKESYVEPVVEGAGYRITVKVGEPRDVEATINGTKLARANFRCLISGAPISGDYIKAQGQAGLMSARAMAIVAEGERGRIYVAPTAEHEAIAGQAQPTWKPDVEFFQKALGFRVGNYGLTKWSDLFTNRQLAVLATFCDLVREGRDRALTDAIAAGLQDDRQSLNDGGDGASAYADAISVYLGLSVSRMSQYWSNLASWHNSGEKMQPVFGRQAVPMIWDFAEANPFSTSSGSYLGSIDWVQKSLQLLPASILSTAINLDASTQTISEGKIVSTDPPYYDNIGYADLSDFFYVWLRRSLQSIFPSLFATLVVPKAEELVATPGRHGGREGAEAFFLNGMTRAMHRLTEYVHPAFPVTIYYAFKQSESDGEEGTSRTGWETFLDAVIHAGFAISGTWPIRTEMKGRVRDRGQSNALASSVILVCRPRASDVPAATRRDFINALKAELPIALANLQRGNIAPVDLAQAAIGPGMAVYTRYAKVLDASGVPLTVRDALSLINQALDEVLAQQEGDFDADTRWALTWFEQSGFAEGDFGVADVLARAKDTSVDRMRTAGIVASKGGKVRLLRPSELVKDLDSAADPRLTVWEVVHQLIRVLESDGEEATAELAGRLGSKAEIARELAYRLYTMCERKKRTQEALSYNGLVQSWPEILRLSRDHAPAQTQQAQMFSQE